MLSLAATALDLSKGLSMPRAWLRFSCDTEAAFVAISFKEPKSKLFNSALKSARSGTASAILSTNVDLLEYLIASMSFLKLAPSF